MQVAKIALHLGVGLRFAIIKSLSGVAAKFLQPIPYLHAFDALGGRGKTEGMTEANNRFDEFSVLGV
jgi:hypothetical protein